MESQKNVWGPGARSCTFPPQVRRVGAGTSSVRTPSRQSIDTVPAIVGTRAETRLSPAKDGETAIRRKPGSSGVTPRTNREMIFSGAVAQAWLRS